MVRVVPSAIVDFIDQAFQEVVRKSGAVWIPYDRVAQLRVLLTLLDNLDEALTPIGRNAYNFLIAREIIRNHLVGWEQHGSGYRGNLKSTPGIAEENPVWVLRQLLKKCSDLAAPATTAELNFVEDVEYRARLREDVFAAESAFNNKEFKAATVMAGSVVEALLLLAIERAPKDDLDRAVKAPKNRDLEGKGIEFATLGQLERIARQLGLYSDEALRSVTLAAEFRNLIHPGKEKRKQAQCNQATARSALAAMDHLIAESENRRRSS